MMVIIMENVKKFNEGGNGYEPFWKSRRFYGGILAISALVGAYIFNEHSTIIHQVGLLLASSFGLASYYKPKVQ